MPKERIWKSGRDGFADLLVQWGRDEIGDDPTRARVRLFLIAAELGVPGAFMFHPDLDRAGEMTAEQRAYWEEVQSIGPVDVMLDREQINRLIRVLRRARDHAYGRDV